MLYYDTSNKLEKLCDVMSRNAREVNKNHFEIRKLAEQKDEERRLLENRIKKDQEEAENERIRVKNLLKIKLGIKGTYSNSKIELNSGEDIFLKTFFSTLHGDWSSSLGIVNTAHFDKGMLRSLLLKRELNIDNLLQINSDYLFDNSTDYYAIEANNKKNLPINFFNSLEKLTINNSNIEFLAYARLPKLKKLVLNSCFYGAQLIGTKLTRNVRSINIEDDVLNFFKLNHLDCKIDINN